MNQVAVIGVPSSVGARRAGQELAPSSLRSAGIVRRLQFAGLDVLDYGDLPLVPFSRDDDNPKGQNIAKVREVAMQVEGEVSRAVESGAKPIVIGGDCTVTLGVVAGFLNCERNLGLVYFDGDVDLNTPATTLSGICDGMVLAHILGKGSEQLTRIGPRFPLMDETDIVMFGHNLDAGGIDPIEIQLLSRVTSWKYPSTTVRGNAKVAAQRAIEHLVPRLNRIIVHFDLDVIDQADFSAVDVPHNNGLSYSEAMAALSVFVSNPAFGGLAITEFNASKDKDGLYAGRLIESIGKAFEGAHMKWRP